MEEYEADSDTNAAQPGERDSDDAEDSDEEGRYTVKTFCMCPCTCCLLLPVTSPSALNWANCRLVSLIKQLAGKAALVLDLARYHDAAAKRA